MASWPLSVFSHCLPWDHTDAHPSFQPQVPALFFLLGPLSPLVWLFVSLKLSCHFSGEALPEHSHPFHVNHLPANPVPLARLPPSLGLLVRVGEHVPY